jgi:biotin carboxyl carrier protein
MVALERLDGGGRHDYYRATLDGRTWTLDAHWVDAGTLSLLLRDEPAGERLGFTVREVGLVRRSSVELALSFGGRTFTAVTGGRATAAGPRHGPPRATASGPARPSEAVRSPMPGRIVRVLVAVGDRVAIRQSVVVVEAMKMENELRSTRDGVVSEVKAIEGATVESGTTLVVIE